MNKIIEDWKQTWPELEKATFNDLTNYIYEFWTQARVFSSGSSAEMHKIEQIKALCEVYLNKFYRPLNAYLPSPKPNPLEEVLKRMKDTLSEPKKSKPEPSWHELSYPMAAEYTFKDNQVINVRNVIAVINEVDYTYFRLKDESTVAIPCGWLAERIYPESPNPTK